MKTCLIDVGGGMRGIYAAGVLDNCIDNNINFDLGIGVSAGSANIASFIARQKKRNYRSYTEYALRKEYMSFKNFIKKHSYLDLDYVYSTLSNSDGEDPLDYQTFSENPMDYIAVATDAITGKAHYFHKNDFSQDNYDVCKASSAIPFICKPQVIYGVPYFDGAASDPIPVKKAIEAGCDKIILILTKPRDFIRTPKKDKFIAARIKRKYPVASEQFIHRAERYNAGVEMAKEYEKDGKVLIIAPEDTFGMETLTKDKQAMNRMYELGYKDADKITDYLCI